MPSRAEIGGLRATALDRPTKAVPNRRTSYG